jgi:hypothetical protein
VTRELLDTKLSTTIVKLIVSFTFSDEGEYSIRLNTGIAEVRIRHVKNSEGLEEVKGIRFEGSPRMVPDDPLGTMYISKIEIQFPFSPKNLTVKNPKADDVSIIRYVSMKYLSRLTEVIRFATQRYWVKMISLSDVNVFEIEVKEEEGKEGYFVTIPLSSPKGHDFPVPIYEEYSKRNFIDTILVKGHRVMLSENVVRKSYHGCTKSISFGKVFRGYYNC